MKRLIIVTLTTLSALTISAQQLPYQNPNLSPAERAEDLCSRLTLEEKALLMMDRSPAIPRLGIPQFRNAAWIGTQWYCYRISHHHGYGLIL